MSSRTGITQKAMYLVLVLFTATGAWAQTWERASDVRSGQSGKVIGSVVDVDLARGRFAVVPDQDPKAARLTVANDAISSEYIGFGSGTEVFRGSKGLAKVSIGDRVEVHGQGAANSIVNADEVILLGREVKSPVSAGAGTSSINTGTATSRTVDGTVRQVSTNADRVVIETSSRELYTVYGTSSTPVYFQGGVYHMQNIEIGDRIRVQFEGTARDSVTAKRIDVLASVSPMPGGKTLTAVVGRITRIDPRALTFRVVQSRSNVEVRIDASKAASGTGKTFRISDLHTGDVVEISGRYDGDTFVADTIRFSNAVIDVPSPPVVEAPDDYNPPDEDQGDEYVGDTSDDGSLEAVVIYGTVDRALGDSDALVVRDTTNNRTVRINVVDDFIIRLKSGSYVTVDQLQRGDRVVIQAYRIGSGRYVAQTIRTR